MLGNLFEQPQDEQGNLPPSPGDEESEDMEVTFGSTESELNDDINSDNALQTDQDKGPGDAAENDQIQPAMEVQPLVQAEEPRRSGRLRRVPEKLKDFAVGHELDNLLDDIE